MNLLDIQIKHKTFGIYFLILSSIASLLSIGLLTLLFAFFFIYATLSLGSSGMALNLTFFSLSLLTITVCIAGIYTGIRYIRGNSLKRNKKLGTVLIALGLLYLGYSLFGYILSNLTDNPGGELKVVMALIWTLLIVPLGLVLRNPKKIKTKK